MLHYFTGPMSGITLGEGGTMHVQGLAKGYPSHPSQHDSHRHRQEKAMARVPGFWYGHRDEHRVKAVIHAARQAPFGIVC